MKPAEYHLLSVAEKEKVARNRMREPDVECPQCEAKTRPADLLRHLDRWCPGHRPPHHLSKWLTWSEAIAAGATRWDLDRWTKNGRLQTEGKRGSRRYLERELVKLIAQKKSKAASRGVRKSASNRKGQPKRWTKRRPDDPRKKMRSDQPLKAEVTKRLEALAQELGGIAPASRQLGIPERTLRAAVRGLNLRTGTRLLIEHRLGEARDGER